MNKYNVGDKFLINIKELVKSNNDEILYKSDCYGIIFSEEQLDKLQKYNEIKERLELIDELKMDEYNKGLEDAWELLKTFYGMEVEERKEAFGGYTVDRLLNMPPQQALAKIEAYEKTKGIKVGDVVFGDDEPDVYGIVTFVSCEMIYIMWSDGSSGVEYDFRDIKKTGKHIDITSVLEQLRGE